MCIHCRHIDWSSCRAKVEQHSMGQNECTSVPFQIGRVGAVGCRQTMKQLRCVKASSIVSPIGNGWVSARAQQSRGEFPLGLLYWCRAEPCWALLPANYQTAFDSRCACLLRHFHRVTPRHASGRVSIRQIVATAHRRRWKEENVNVDAWISGG